jgi:hypothetical protein
MHRSPELWLRLFQLSIAPGAVLTATNDLHGLAGKPMAKLGIPRWFVRWIGVWKAGALVLNFAGDAYVSTAQGMLSVLMGGAIFSHVVVERNALKALPALAFLATSIAVPILRGATPPVQSACISVALAVSGYVTGHGIQATGTRSPPPKAARRA